MPLTDDPVEVALMLQRASTILCSGYNASYFGRSWWRLSGAGNGRRARRVAAAVLALTNLAFLVTSASPVLPGGAWRPGLQALVGLLPLAAAAAMTVLILRNRARR